MLPPGRVGFKPMTSGSILELIPLAHELRFFSSPLSGTRCISRKFYSPKIIVRVIVEVFNEIFEGKTTNEIKQTRFISGKGPTKFIARICSGQNAQALQLITEM